MLIYATDYVIRRIGQISTKTPQVDESKILAQREITFVQEGVGHLCIECLISYAATFETYLLIKNTSK